MPQAQFPFFPEGVTHITSLLAFARRDGQVTYFNASMPVFVHAQTDLASFRMITAQFVVLPELSQIPRRRLGAGGVRRAPGDACQR